MGWVLRVRIVGGSELGVGRRGEGEKTRVG